MRLYTPPRVKMVPPQATRVFKGVIYDTYQWEQELFDGSKTTFEMLKRPDTVRILAIVDDKIVIIKQEQPHVGLFIDIPGGFHDKEGETELDAAKRELKEETGVECKNWKLIEAVQAHNKIEQFNYLFLAFDAVDGNTLESRKQKLDIGERVEVTYLSLEEAKKICDDPIVRFLPKNILSKVKSVEELKSIQSLIDLV